MRFEWARGSMDFRRRSPADRLSEASGSGERGVRACVAGDSEDVGG